MKRLKKLIEAILHLFEPPPPLTLRQQLLLAHILNATPRRRL